MRKWVLLALILFLLLPAVLAHSADDSQYVGTWVQENYDEETGRYSVEILRLTEDHQAYYSVSVFYPGKVSICRQSAKTWWTTYNGIHIVLGENVESDAVILSDGRLGFKLAGNAYSPFIKISD